jgi:hypothetical protein
MLSVAAQHYRVLQTAVREHEICSVFNILRSIGVEPVLLKGWSVSRFYADPPSRCLGDIDLLVRDDEVCRAEAAVRDGGPVDIDWHSLSCTKREFADPEGVVLRSKLVPLGGSQIRVLCDEDNLHFVAIHMLRHGGWSPVWIQDVAVLLASRPANFDWDVCLGASPTRAGWVLSALVLAHKLTGADIGDTPAEAYQIPRWLEGAVLKAQKTPDPADNQPPEGIWTALAHPWRLPSGIRKRWPNPITAAIETGAAIENRRPLAHQLRYFSNLTGKFFCRAFQYAIKTNTSFRTQES